MRFYNKFTPAEEILTNLVLGFKSNHRGERTRIDLNWWDDFFV